MTKKKFISIIQYFLLKILFNSFLNQSKKLLIKIDLS